jgi:hypothetical protein
MAAELAAEAGDSPLKLGVRRSTGTFFGVLSTIRDAR